MLNQKVEPPKENAPPPPLKPFDFDSLWKKFKKNDED